MTEKELKDLLDAEEGKSLYKGILTSLLVGYFVAFVPMEVMLLTSNVDPDISHIIQSFINKITVAVFILCLIFWAFFACKISIYKKLLGLS
ncbi:MULTISPECIES: hypothetical protein [unclassified Desulfovibrio]|uniref:hypothetical protein n=1 Tax=unclassified Desulfovibrio TaxID=2593640 RepID=UPI0013EABF38|nr:MULTISPECIES: hypothetical protein [unclassified Desulfovibrio]